MITDEQWLTKIGFRRVWRFGSISIEARQVGWTAMYDGILMSAGAPTARQALELLRDGLRQDVELFGTEPELIDDPARLIIAADAIDSVLRGEGLQ